MDFDFFYIVLQISPQADPKSEQVEIRDFNFFKDER